MQQFYMSDMKDIKTAIGKNYSLVIAPPLGNHILCLIFRNDFVYAIQGSTPKGLFQLTFQDGLGADLSDDNTARNVCQSCCFRHF